MASYAWVTLVFDAKSKQQISSGISAESNEADDYVGMAAVLGRALREVSRIPTVCMIARDNLDDASIAFLRRNFDEIAIVDFIEFPVIAMSNDKTQKIYGNWISKSFTKWQCLTLIKYDKICFVDADMLPVANIDDVFELEPPSATFAFPWAKPFAAHSDLYNPYLKKGNPPKHGDIIEYRNIKIGLKPAENKKGFVANGSLVLLRPSLTAFDKFMRFVNELTKSAPYGNKSCINGFDEQSIAEFYNSQSVNWHHIGNNYNYFIGKPDFLKFCAEPIKVYHFRSTKPQHMKKDEWPDLAHWWRIADLIIEEMPESARWIKHSAN